MTKPKRFFLTWMNRGRWYQSDYRRKPRVEGMAQSHLLEDLENDTTITGNFDLRQVAALCRGELGDLRKKQLDKWRRYREWLNRPRPALDERLAKRRAARLADLQAKEKNWQRKAKLAATKLRKIRRSIKELLKHEAQTNPAQ